MLAPAFTPPLVPRTLTTTRLHLVPVCEDDVPHVQRILSDERVGLPMACAVPYPEDGAQKWIERAASRLESGDGVSFAIRLPATTQFICAAGLMIHLHHARATLWYWLDVPFWNNGYATEAAYALTDYAFTDLQLNRVEAYHHPQNPASGRIMQKLGMSYEGVMRNHTRRGNNYADSVLHAILREEWPPKPRA